MNKIMIVDDMPIFLEYLRGCIDWEIYGFEICCEAHDGREALEKMEEYLPDVVLTDITMPYLNGLELSEEIVKNYPDTAVILITGNNEFEYARKAVKIGVCDYIVKPFEKEELILSLLKLKDNMARAVESASSDKEDRISTDYRMQESLRKLIYAGGNDSEEDIRRELELSEGYPLLAVCKLVNTGKGTAIGSEADREELMNWEQMFARMLRGRIEIDGEYRLFHDYENNIVVLLSFNRQSARDQYKGYEFTDLSQIIKSQLNMEMHTCFGEPADGFLGLRFLYERLLNKLADKGTEAVYDLRTFVKSEDKWKVKPQISLDAISRLNHDLETLQADDAEETIREIWDRISQGDSPMSDVNILSGAVSVLLTNIIQAGFSMEAIYGKGFSPERELMGLKSSEEMRDKIIELYRKRIDYQKSRNTSKSHSIAVAAREYIERNYANNQLSIADISGELLVNQTYLRKMFKDEMNMTLQEYMTSFRMQEAKRLILETDEKLAEVAENVGYSDVSYFSNCFKKFYGVSPRSMKK